MELQYTYVSSGLKWVKQFVGHLAALKQVKKKNADNSPRFDILNLIAMIRVNREEECIL